MEFGAIFTRALQVTWRNRALWLFGVLFALFGGEGARFNNVFNYNFSSGDRLPVGGGKGLPPLPDINEQAVAVIIAAVVCLALIWFLLSILMRFMSRGALIGLVSELETGQVKPTVRRGFGIGSERFLSLLGIGVVVNVPIVIISLLLFLIAVLPILALVLPVIGTSQSRTPDQLVPLIVAGAGGSVFLICCAVLLVVIIALVVKPFYEFFVRVCVVDRRGTMDSIREGYRMVRAHLGNVLVLYVILIVVGFAFGVLMIPVGLALIAIPVGAAVAAGVASNSVTPAIIAGVVLGIPVFLILLLIAGIYQSFESSVWTEGFLALRRPAVPIVAPSAPVTPPPAPTVTGTNV